MKTKTKTKRLWAFTIIAFFLAAFIGGCKDENVGVVGVCPQVLSTNPANLATNIPLDQVITVTFNENMNPASFTQASFTLDGVTTVGVKKTNTNKKSASATQSINSVATGNVSCSGAITTYTPTSPLTINTTYTARITTAVKDLKGNILQVDYVWTFSTGATLSPVVISTDPTDSASCVAVNTAINVTFSVPMDSSTITTTTFILAQGATPVLGTVSYKGLIASFKPATNLVSGTKYTATVTTGVKNLSGTALVKNIVWTFTAGCNSVPIVTSTDPGNNSTGIALNKVISATFSVPMDTSTLTTTTFTLKQGATAVNGTVSNSGSTVTFTPTSELLSGTTYTATITTGAKNLASISLARDSVWNFSTVAPLGPLVVDLKTVARFGIIAGVGVSNDAGFSVINNLDVGISPGVLSSVTGFPPAIINNGAIYAADAGGAVTAMLTQAQTDLTSAYLFAQNAVSPAPATVSGDIGGTTLAPGIYKSTSTLLIQNGDLTLDAQGDVNAVWIFQIASAFTTVGGAGGNIILAGGAQAKNIFWQTSSSATIGDGTIFKGNILALTSITMNSGAVATGRMLARNGSVVMTSTNTINKP
jgi:hypothetical protein